MINIAVCDDDLEITKSINKLLMKYQDERDLDFTVDLFNDGSGLKSSILKGKKYDLIFAGPPYALSSIDEIPIEIFKNELLKEEGWFILEHTPKNDYRKFDFYRTERNYGTTIFSIFVNRQDPNI